MAWWRKIRSYVGMRRAEAFLRCGDNGQALQRLNRVLEGNPMSAYLHFLRGVAFERLGNADAAISCYDRAIQLNPTQAIAYNNRGELLFSRGLYDMALLDVSRAIDLDPTIARAYFLRGCLRRLRGEIEDAIADLTQANRLDGTDEWVLIERAYGWYARGQLEEALVDLDAAIHVNGNNGDAYVFKGVIWDKKGNMDLALANIDIGLRRDVRYPADAYYRRAALRLRSREIELAIDDYTQAIQRAPDYVDYYVARSGAYREKGDLDAALRDGDQATRLAPGSTSAWENLGWVLWELNRYEAAVAAFEAALASDANNTGALTGLVWALATSPEATIRRDPEKAMANAMRIEKREEIPDWQRESLLAVAYAECGHFDDAAAHLATATKTAPAEYRRWFEEILGNFRRGLPYRAQSGGERL